ncbi:hypothetical protein M8C21_020108, partial [Ambrosia artemisiifolia]
MVVLHWIISTLLLLLPISMKKLKDIDYLRPQVCKAMELSGVDLLICLYTISINEELEKALANIHVIILTYQRRFKN